MSGDLPTDFGFAIDVHAHEPETVYVVPITSDSHHFVPDGKLRVYRSRSGGDEWEALGNGLPQEHCYVNVLRDAMAVDSLDDVRRVRRHHRRPGVRLARRRRPLAGDRARPAGRAVGGSADARVMHGTSSAPDDARPIRVVLPALLRDLAGVEGEVTVAAAEPVCQRTIIDALEAAHPMLRGTLRDGATGRRRALVRFYACADDLSHADPDVPVPDAVQRGEEPFLVVGAIAGG